MPVPPAIPADLSVVFADDEGIAALLTSVGLLARVDDDNDGLLDTPAEQSNIDKAKFYATQRVLFYCDQYEVSELSKSWLVYEWANIIAARWLCGRGANPVPDQIEKLYQEALADLQAIHDGRQDVPGLTMKDAGFPAWSNVRVDSNYDVKKIRVQRPISEQTPTGYSQTDDGWASGVFEW